MEEKKKKQRFAAKKSMHVFALQTKLYLFSLLGIIGHSIQDLWAWVMLIEVFQ